ncbi:SpoIIE family protein phosphatase [Actinomadura sp. DC4]|uniref:SpoIIE family protein phosphatase n=1 Tax=Actinomadura sp. DC4 TaxID=3055069 RepID=UPI0025B18B0F|nr:SpoIIE family protein phosphatase [Actinomadura sp. DC4]MDN3351545.1 SpoIIE family protein phosphatase [Actinomadura sp. DC4]
MEHRPEADDRRPETAAMAPGLTALATLAVTTTGSVLHWSPAAAGLFGRADAEVHGRDLCEAVLGGEHRAVVASAVTGAATGAASVTVLPVRLGDGHTVPVEFRWEPLTDAAGGVTVGVSALPRHDEESVTDGRPADQTILGIGATLDLRQTARELADALISRLCYGAGVYVLERLLVDDQMPSYEEAESRVVVRRMALVVSDGTQGEWASAFPADEVIAYAADTTVARSMTTGRPIVFTSLDSQTLGRFKDRLAVRPRINEALSYHSFLTVPLIARGHVMGFTVLARRPGEPPFTRAEATLAHRIAEHAAVCMDNGRLYDRERRTSKTLQRSLLPVALKTPPGTRIAHRYLPAGQTSRIGGDWYDVIPLPGGKVALVVGDAMGHGTAAALVMGQLRTAVRILARLGLPPADLLRHLDEIAQELTTAQFATCVYALCDPGARTLTIARAGHVPPILATADGASVLLDLPPGLPLGVGEASYEAMEIHFPDDATLVLCTDGLVESRDRDMDTGLAELRSLLPGTLPDLEATCEAVVEHLHTGAGADDATLLLARLTPRPPG